MSAPQPALTPQPPKAPEARAPETTHSTASLQAPGRGSGSRLQAAGQPSSSWRLAPVVRSLLRAVFAWSLAPVARSLRSPHRRTKQQLSRLNRSLLALSACSQALVHATEEPQLLQRICQIFVDQCGYLLAWVGYAEADENKTVRVVASAGTARDYMQTGMVSWADVPRGRGPTGPAIRTGRPVRCDDTLTDPCFAPWRERALARGFRSCIALPLLLDSPQSAVGSPGPDYGLPTTDYPPAFGALSLYSPLPNAFDDQEVRLLSQLAQDLAFGIQTLRTRAQHQRAEQRLRYLAAIVEDSEDAIYSKALDGTIVTWNRGAEKIYGYTAAEAIGRNVSLLTPPDRVDEMDRLLRQIAAGETVEHYETVRLCKDGSRRQVSLCLSPLRDCQGQAVGASSGSPGTRLSRVVGCSSIARDITARKRAEERLRAQQHYTRSLIEASLDPLVTISKDGKIMDVNHATELVTGVARDQLIGADFCAFFTEPDKARQGYERVFAEGSVHDYPLAIRHSSGRVTEVLYNAAVFTNEAGVVEGIFAAARDVTELKQAERRLYDQQFYTRSLIEASLDPLMTTDAAGLITDVNQQMELLTGCVRAQLIGSEFKHYCTEPERAEEGIRRVLREGKVTDYELTVRSREGAPGARSQASGKAGSGLVPEASSPEPRETVVAYNATVFRNWEGDVAGVFAAARDITERKRAQQQLERSAAELARSNADLQDFASIASHDLQEPLRKVLAFGDQLQQHCGPQLDELGRDFLGRMQNAAARMSNLINALLEYSRVSSRARPFQPLDLQQLVLEVIADLETSIQEAHAQVEVGVMPRLVADTTQMRQLLQNLVSNAIKFHLPGVAPRVWIDSRALPSTVDGRQSTAADRRPEPAPSVVAGTVDYWEIRVRDNGIGFEEKHLERIFRPFQRLHGRSEYQGSGMGLAICRKIVARHGGTLTASSQPGQGATFIVTLPALSP